MLELENVKQENINIWWVCETRWINGEITRDGQAKRGMKADKTNIK